MSRVKEENLQTYFSADLKVVSRVLFSICNLNKYQNQMPKDVSLDLVKQFGIIAGISCLVILTVIIVA